ncbi:MAG: ABC transporter permease DevC [Desulfobacteraceae bacterium]|nr:ABC transporter permease DevC [Desulfobacteraceae bacterium]
MSRLHLCLSNMFAPLGIPLAWRQLSRDRMRFMTAIGGVTFGVVLMLYQMGLYTASLRMVVFPHSTLKGDLVIISQNYEYFYQNRFFSRRLLYQLQGFPGVDSIAPLQVNYLRWKNTTTGVNMTIAVLACNPSQNPFVHPEITEQLHLLKNSENVLFDRKSARADFGKVGDAFDRQGEVISEVEHSRVKVKGLFSMGQTLAATGHIITSDEALGRYYPQRSSNMINFGLVTLSAGADPEEVRQRLSAFLPPDVRVITREEFRNEEQNYWLTRTAIGFICIAGMVVGMFVGAIVVYQILYTDVTDHLREYATLKALGITDWFLFRLIMTEALILLLTSFFPSTMIASVMFHITREGAGMPTRLALTELLIVFCMAAVMCVVSGFLATRKLKTADPADIF